MRTLEEQEASEALNAKSWLKRKLAKVKDERKDQGEVFRITSDCVVEWLQFDGQSKEKEKLAKHHSLVAPVYVHVRDKEEHWK